MIRFCKKELLNTQQLQKTYGMSPVSFNKDIWEKGRAFFKYNEEEFSVLPVSNEMGEIICYAYQDDEANRELRMIRELCDNDSSLTFSDIFPDYKSITICGCNELAYYCAEYMKKQCLEVKVLGEYWNFLGYSISCESLNSDDMNIYAEGVRPKKDWYHNFLTSVSAEFECIDMIYERNILYSKIANTSKSYYELLSVLHKADNIIIIGDDISSQDTYDLLLSEGIDIYGFLVEKEKKHKRLFGKPVLYFDEVLERIVNPILIQGTDENSALGSKVVDKYDYYGYRRNKNFFVIRDYIKVPDSNLINVLDNKKVVLLGEHRLCEILGKYLTEKSRVHIRQMSISGEVEIGSDEIVLLVNPIIYYNAKPDFYEESLKQLAPDKRYDDYTEYFSRHEAFIVMDVTQTKYLHTSLRPKGIFLGKNKGLSGTIFLRGILDGHPNILLVKRDFSFNIFWYCIRLADVKTENIMCEFWTMYEEENDQEVIKKDFPQKDKFIEKAEGLIEKGKTYTAQEIFVLLHIAYSAMWNEERESDISKVVIYWEPHIGSAFLESRKIVSYFARWLESSEIQGYSMVLSRNAIVRGGSHIGRFGIAPKDKESINRFQVALFSKFEKSDMQYKYWREFFVRFEDIKLNPKDELEKLCQVMDIPWSETLLQTTDHEKTDSVFGVTGFDLAPVYNIRDNCLSAYDRMKIALGSSEIQDMYGYPSVNLMNFSRRELQDMFLKSLRIQREMHFKNVEEYVEYVLKIQKAVRDHLWRIRKEAILHCIQQYHKWTAVDKSLFYRVLAYLKKDIYSDDIFDAENNIFRWMYIYQNKLDNLMTTFHSIKKACKIIFYGTGRDAEGLLNLLDKSDINKILFADKKALTQNYNFYGKRVLTLCEVTEKFRDYPILITSSYFFGEIETELLEVGISKDRIMYNTFGFGESII